MSNDSNNKKSGKRDMDFACISFGRNCIIWIPGAPRGVPIALKRVSGSFSDSDGEIKRTRAGADPKEI